MLLLLLACQASTAVVGSGPIGPDMPASDDPGSGVSSPDDPSGIEDVSGNGDPVEEEEVEVGDFFDDTRIHQVDITLSNEAARALDNDPYAYVDAGVTIDGTPFAHVGVHLRGKIGSFRDLSGKPKFKIDINHFDPDQRFGDYESLALNNAVVDCSYLKEATGYAVFRQLGLPAGRTAYTQVTVNGDPYGLYVGVEFPDDRFLKARYEDPSGNLYDGKYLYWNGNYSLIDFTEDQVEDFQLEEGTDVGHADVIAISDAAAATGPFQERFGGLLDLDSFHRHLAAEQWTGHIDGYAMNTNNYRVYFDPSDGLAEFVVYDLDYGFLPAESWGMDWARPRGVIAADCFRDPLCAEAHRQAVAQVVSEIDTDALLAQMDTWSALIEEAAAADPRRECRARSIAPEQEAVRAWVEGGSAALSAYWAE